MSSSGTPPGPSRRARAAGLDVRGVVREALVERGPATDFQEIDSGVIESDAPLPQAVDGACALQDLDFDALQPVDAGNLADKVDQCRTSAYARSIAKSAPRDASMVEKSSLRLRRPFRHADEHHEGQRTHRNHDGKHHGDAQKKPHHAKNRDPER